MLRDNPELVQRYHLRDRFQARIAELLDYHRRVEKQLEQEQAVAKLFNAYEDVSFFALPFGPRLRSGKS